MYKGTTPTYTLTLPSDVDLSDALSVYVTFGRRGTKILQKTGDDLAVDANVIEVYLTQAETLSLPSGVIQIQVNWTYLEGTETKRAASDIVTTIARKNLESGVLS